VIALRVVAAALDDIASQAQSAADTESVSISGDTMTGDLSGTNISLSGSITAVDVTATGNVSLTGALLVNGNTAVDKSGSNYMVYHDGGGGPALYAGNSTDNRNYYQSNQHRFRSNDAGTNFAEISSVGMIIGDDGPEANMG
jgi:hypothetical protein